VKRPSRDHTHLPCHQRFVVQPSVVESQRIPIPPRVQCHLAGKWLGHHECATTLSHFIRSVIGVQSQFAFERLGRPVLVGGEWFWRYEVDGQISIRRSNVIIVGQGTGNSRSTIKGVGSRYGIEALIFIEDDNRPGGVANIIVDNIIFSQDGKAKKSVLIGDNYG